MEIIHQLLVFLHLLGFGMLVGTYMLQQRAGAQAPLNKGWLHGSGVMLITGVLMMGLDPVLGTDLDHMRLGIKLVVLLVLGGFAIAFLRKPSTPKWLNPTLGAFVVLNLGIALLWP